MALIQRSEEEMSFHGLIDILCTLAKRKVMGDSGEMSWSDEIDPTAFTTDLIKDIITPLYDKSLFLNGVSHVARVEVLRNWEVMVNQLTEEIDKGDVADGRCTLMIQVIDVCTELISKPIRPRGRQKKQDSEETLSQDMTCSFIPHLGPWINEFQMDIPKVPPPQEILRDAVDCVFCSVDASNEAGALCVEIRQSEIRRDFEKSGGGPLQAS